MKVLHLSYGDGIWGAFRAVHRIHTAVSNAGCDSYLWVEQKSTDDPKVIVPRARHVRMLRTFLKWRVSERLRKELGGFETLWGPAVVPSNFANRIARFQPDVTHIHWTSLEFLSLRDLARIQGPVVWTPHDMWLFSGAQHYATDDAWKSGYANGDRPVDRANRRYFRRKLKLWRTPRYVAAPSNWLAQCTSESPLTSTWPTRVVGNPIDVDFWKPVATLEARNELGLDPDKSYIVFGAMGAEADPNKGFDLLAKAMQSVRAHPDTTELIVFGGERVEVGREFGFVTHRLGHVTDDERLRLIYAGADVFVVPSRREAFGQTAAESMACGTAVVGFDGSGLSDIVIPEKTGFLAPPHDTTSLAACIDRVLDSEAAHRAKQDGRPSALSIQARRHIVETFSSDVVGRRIVEVYEAAIDGNRLMKD